jgi:hypothetical protein
MGESYATGRSECDTLSPEVPMNARHDGSTDRTALAFVREVRELHRFFERWYAGELAPVGIERLAVLAPSFEMISPEGRTFTRSEVAGMISAGYGSRPMKIEIRNAAVRYASAPFVMGRYEEWQTVDGVPSGRISTAVMVEDERMPNGLRWVHLHETRLPETRS